MRRVEFRTSPATNGSEEELLALWLDSIQHIPAPARSFVEDVFADVVTTGLGGGVHTASALRRFGRRLGAEGWSLAELRACIEALARVDAVAAARLDHFEVGIALAEGWAEGARATAGADTCLDPLTGFVRVPVLRIRLQQVYDHCASLSIGANDAYRLVVVDCAAGEQPAFVRDATRVVVAEQLRATFAGGETLSATEGGRLLVLAATSQQLGPSVTALLDVLRATPLLQQVPVLAWIEPLPADPDDLPSFLADVSG